MEAKKKSTPLGGFLKGKGKIILLVAGALLGVLLLAFGGGDAEKSAEAAAESYMSHAELEEYRAELESEIARLCDAVAGVGSVEVMVTLSHGGRVVYATDADGDPATVGSGSSQRALPAELQPPAIAGVGVVCRGGDTPAVQEALIELLSTALGISTARVFVTGK